MTAQRTDLWDLDHLSPEDADLFVALYWERNGVSRGEAARVRINRERADAEPAVSATLDAWENWEELSPEVHNPGDRHPE